MAFVQGIKGISQAVKTVVLRGRGPVAKASDSIFMQVAERMVKTVRPETSAWAAAKEVFLKRFLDAKNIKLDKETVMGIDSLSNFDFVVACRDTLWKAMGMPQELIPGIAGVSTLAQKSLGAQYEFSTHTIQILGNIPLKKSRIFGAIAHELQHAKQNITYYRSSSTAPKLREMFKKDLIKAQNEKIPEMISAIKMRTSTEEGIGDAVNNLISAGIPKDMAMQKVMQYKKATPEELTEILNKEFQTTLNSFDINFEKIRQLFVSKSGVLPQKEEIIAETLFNSIEKGIVGSPERGLKYWHALHELEAYRVGTAAKRAYTRMLKK